MKHIYLIAAALSCSAITVTSCAPGVDSGGAPPAVATAISAVTAPTVIVTGGLSHTCAVSSNRMQCWGSGDHGQLGGGSTGQSIQPVTVTGIQFASTTTSAGNRFTCAVVNGAARCWGANDHGQLGNAPSSDDSTVRGDSNVPVGVTNLGTGAQLIAAGDSHGCAVVGGAARCWGSNSSGQIGDASSVPVRRSPVGVFNLSSGVQAITAGEAHSCAIVNGAATCWGRNNNGQLGNATPTNSSPGNSNAPVPVTGLGSGVIAIAAGQNHTCAIVSGGTVSCWGSNSSGQIGSLVPPGEISGSPVPITGLGGAVVAIAAGANHTCAILTSGAAQCWGANVRGQLGNGSLGDGSSVPVQVTGLTSGVQSIAAGSQHSCATTAGGTFCWGANDSGQIAVDPSSASQFVVPHQISGLVLGACADGSDEQVFNNGMVGCAGAATFASRAGLCASGYQPATTLQWTSNRGTANPTHHYWTNDVLFRNGTASSACFASPSVGTDCGSTAPMHVCASSSTDPEGNACSFTHCGLYANAPDQFFGGCAGSTTAGTVCIPTFAAPNACTHFSSCPKWENGFTTNTNDEDTSIFGSSEDCYNICYPDEHCDGAICSGGMSDPSWDCLFAGSDRLSQVQQSVSSAVSAEASFDTPAALAQRRADAVAAVRVDRGSRLEDYNVSTQPAFTGPVGMAVVGGGGGDGGGGDGGGGGGAIKWTWSQHLRCVLTVTTATAVRGPNEACGCGP